MNILLPLLIIPLLVNAEVPLTSFFPYGTSNGDAKLQTVDDGSSAPQNLSIPFPFFNVPQSTLWVNENGIITFDRKSSQFTPYCKPVPSGGGRIIAPFWADVDIRHTGNVFYRQTTDAAILQKGEHEIAFAFTDEQNIHLKWAFISTWEEVTYFQDLGNHNESERKKNTFQVTLLTDGIQGFAIFYYNKITWTTGDVSDGQNGLGGTPAEIGYDYGDGINYFTVDDSCKNSVINITQKSNVGSPGVWIFKLGANIDATPTPLPGCEKSYTGEFCAIPNTIDFVGYDLIDIYGIQLTSTESAICRYNDPGANITLLEAKVFFLTHYEKNTNLFKLKIMVTVLARIPWFSNACPGAHPLDIACVAVGSLAVTGVTAFFAPESLPVVAVALGKDFSNETTYYFPDDVPACPPTFALAKVDPTFVIDRLCTNPSNCMYNTGADVCFISATPSPGGGAQQCCYSKGEINITAPGKFLLLSVFEMAYKFTAAGHPMMSHPSVLAGIPNIALDRSPWHYCCELNHWITRPFCKRPSDPGQNYTAPKPALGNGDPHFTTFDGLYYTFNGAGEFWMLKNNSAQSLAVQTRMIPVGTSYSYFGAYAMKTSNSSVLQIERSSSGEFTVFYDSTPIPPNIWQNGINFDDIYISYDGSVIVTFSSGFSFKISYWMVNSFAPQSFFGNYTQGILGSYDDNPFNDLTTPDGILLPANSTTKVIHYKFGLKWSVSEDESLFNYFGKNYSDFNFPEFKPSFGYFAGQLPPNAAEVCGNDQSCLWDLVTTGDESLANETRSNNEDFNQTVSTTSQNITMCPTFDDIENGSFVLNNYLPNSVVTFYCDSGFEIQGNEKLICKADGSWNGTEPSCDFVGTTTVETTTENMANSPNSPKSSSPTSTTTTTTTTQETTTSNAEQLFINLNVVSISFALMVAVY
uniref:Uncharacterized protein n=1 Tax=Panagrolaimus davidi TaxID=227884 RepID=A0A914P1I8_9BILA